jgi:hypothetical protein
MIDVKDLKNILKIKGEVRGVTLKTDAQYIFSKKGIEGLDLLQDEINRIGLDFSYKDINNIKWYPVGWRIASLLAIKDIFNFTDQDISDMGYSAPKNSFIVKIIMRYFISLEKTFAEASKYWQKHWTVGSLVAKKIDLKNKYLILEVRDFQANPILCTFWLGYFRAITESMLRNITVTVVEKKCMGKG